MSDVERAERIRSLVESFSADQAERDRLKQRADESLEQLHRAVRQLVEDRRLSRQLWSRVDRLLR